VGLLRFGAGVAGGFAGVSSASVDRFADSAVSGGAFEGSAGGGCRRSAMGLREAQPEKQMQKAHNTLKRIFEQEQDRRWALLKTQA
jgi:hypothetical protein